MGTLTRSVGQLWLAVLEELYVMSARVAKSERIGGAKIPSWHFPLRPAFVTLFPRIVLVLLPGMGEACCDTLVHRGQKVEFWS